MTFPRRWATTILLVLLSALPLHAQPAKRPVSQDAFISIGRIEQWVTIKGQDAANPVVLFLHGGPGNALTPYADTLFRGWDKDFTLVQWDQRGAGRTYSKNGSPVMTVERMTADGIELADYLTKRLNKKKIVLVGGSWGSVLGIRMARARPDLFLAYVGISQITSIQAAAAASYATLLKLARAANDRKAVAELTAIGPPRWNRLTQWEVFHRWRKAYEPPDPRPGMKISPAYASDLARYDYSEAQDTSTIILYGYTMEGPLMQVDLPSLGYDFSIPVFMIAGARDLTTPPELARAYFDRITAPHKAFRAVPGMGPEPFTPQSAAVLKDILLTQVRPLAKD